MCATCGCENEAKISIHRIDQPTSLDLGEMKFTPVETKTTTLPNGTKQIDLEQDILLKNNLLAECNRGYFQTKSIFLINLISSPGSGKTSLPEKTLIHI